MSLLFAVILL